MKPELIEMILNDGVYVNDAYYALMPTDNGSSQDSFVRTRLDFAIIKDDKLLVHRVTDNSIHRKVYASNRKAMLPGCYPYNKEIMGAIKHDPTIPVCMANSITRLPLIRYIETVQNTPYIDLYDKPLNIKTKICNDMVEFSILGDYVITYIMLYDINHEKTYVSHGMLSMHTEDYDWWNNGDADEFDSSIYYIGDDDAGLVWMNYSLISLSDIHGIKILNINKSISDTISNIVGTFRNLTPTEVLQNFINDFVYANPFMGFEHPNIRKCIYGLLVYFILIKPMIPVFEKSRNADLTKLFALYDGFVINSDFTTLKYYNVNLMYAKEYPDIFRSESPNMLLIYRRVKSLRGYLKEIKTLLESTVPIDDCVTHGKYCNLRSAIMSLCSALKRFNRVYAYMFDDDIRNISK